MADIDELVATVNRQVGQWKMFMWGIGALLSCILFVAGLHYQAMVSMTEKMEVFSNYAAAHKVETAEGFRRIGNIEGTITQLEHRVVVNEKRIAHIHQEIEQIEQQHLKTGGP